MALFSASSLPASDLRGRSDSFLLPSQLSAASSLRIAPLGRLAARSRRLTALPRRRILSRMEAHKQTDSSFDELLKSDKLVLVDFFATWCGPCKYMVPILEDVGEKMKDKIEVIKIDTEKNKTIADHYHIEALPTFIFFRDGKPCKRFEGAMPADQFIQRIEDALKVQD
ncbi:thioredoxin Y, chloroplastic-like [Canna indica]|uniref:Thioredoxin Y, chloroplastic-like n=1 Tax=Canna indica TaxID=4628 RepID=A0AAQ3K8H8_9LILI|nr:thioredoxin Y, chloroplastic-like [Canna indica]